MSMNITDSVRAVKGVGEKLEQCLNRLDIYCVNDLLEHFPRDYDEFKGIQAISSVGEGVVTAVEGTILALPKLIVRNGMKILTVVLQDATGTITVTWYNMPFLKNQLRLGKRYIMRGKARMKMGGLVLEQPKILGKEEFYNQVGKLRPIYPLTAGLTNNAVEKAVAQCLKAEGLTEYLPADVRKRQGLVEYKKALRQIHFPADRNELQEGRRRLVFDELFLYSLALGYIRKMGKRESGYKMGKREEIRMFADKLPFSLTRAQERVWEEIDADMQSGYVMNRLVQGDVGSGKTIIAVLALYETVLCGFQGAFMAPTEVLAGQHFRVLSELLGPEGVSVGLLAGSLPAGEKRKGKEKLASGEWDIVVGTHAVIQDAVEFHDLALVITDEQHRFGVKQRESLFGKGREPHVLAMSATPIPRTLALILYGDMSLSVLDERPSDRLPIKNCVVNNSYRPSAYRFMKEQIDMGHQVYIICPMVEESEEMELENVTVYADELREIFPESVRIAKLHGRMKAGEKEDVMRRFLDGGTDILVSTTVIEVGIDVPNATVIMIENAERFGLAQLHQLRGRVGRGAAQSYCILMTGREDKDSGGRLQILAKSNDGFEIAREDLRIRGQGDLFGVRQSGENVFALADIYGDANILAEAAKEAERFTKDEIVLFYKKNERLRRRIEGFLGQVTL